MKLKTLILAACFAIMGVVTMTPTESLAQVKCQPGTVNYSTGREPCTPCMPGWYNPDVGGGVCSVCPQGTYCPLGSVMPTQCLGGTFSEHNAGVCRSCRAGTYSAAGAEICTSCPAGKYSAAGAATCTSCPSGQGSLPGSSSCVTCNDQEWTWQKCNNDQCPNAANKNSAGDCKCKKAHNWSRGKQKCVKK